jgi:hypothetical protein
VDEEKFEQREAGPARRRRLSDKILVAFHHACDQHDFEVAERLLVVLEIVVRRPPPAGQPERRRGIETLVAAHERLWLLRNAYAPTL